MKTVVSLDPDVQAVASFMQETIPAPKLAGVARSLAALSGLLWGHLQQEEFRALSLCGAPLIGETRPVAIESGLESMCAGGGSAGAAGSPLRT